MSTGIKIALLRGINVGGRKKVPMADLRTLCTKLGYQSVQSYIQSGNLVFQSDRDDRTIERELSDAIQSKFGFSVSVMVRSGSQWAEYVASNPFPEAALGLQRWAFDAVYTPENTEFLHACRVRGIDTLSGFELFLFQGLDAFRLFTGIETDADLARSSFLQRYPLDQRP